MENDDPIVPASSSYCLPPHLPWLVRLKIRLIHILYNTIFRSHTTLNRPLVSLITLHKTPPNPSKTINGLTTRDITIHSNLTFRLFTPFDTHKQQQKGLPLIIYFHGGGFIFQTADCSNYHAFVSNLSMRLPAVVASLSYRLSPEHKYPSQHQDARELIAFLDAHPHILPDNVDLSSTFLAGDSAGANLAHFAAAAAAATKSSALLSKLTIKGVISIQPFFGGEERTESEIRLFHGPMIPVWVTDWMWRAYLPQGANRDHASCNVYGPNAELVEQKGFPKTLVVVGGYDPLQDRQRRYCEWLRQSGNEVEVELLEFENGIHGFYMFPELNETETLYNHVSNFVYK